MNLFFPHALPAIYFFNADGRVLKLLVTSIFKADGGFLNFCLL